MMNNKRAFNPEALVVARRARGISQRDLAAAVGVTPPTLSKIERQDLPLKRELLTKLAEQLGYPESFFFHEIDVLTPNIIYYRKRAALLAGDLEKVDNLIHIERFRVKQLLRCLALTQKTAPMSVAEYGSPENIARQLRHQWSVPVGPVKNLVHLVEKAGIILLTTDYNSDKLDGMVVPDESALPLIYLNNEKSGDRQRSTLAHELGHWLMHNAFNVTSDKEAEEEANAFAGEFMVPAREFQRMVTEKTTLAGYADLKRYWRMSMQFLIYRAFAIGAISDVRKQSLFQQMSKLGYRKREPHELDLPIERPAFFNNMVKAHLQELDFTPETLQDYLGIMANEVRMKFLPQPANGMKISHRNLPGSDRMVAG
jgi:Zn-dependent peptidase ImmA (M78 family)/DNA-binding XRE family transcriptional regulator